MPSSDEDSRRRSHVQVGRDYEVRAAEFFKSKQYEIVEQNWRAGRREIDLIVRKGNQLVFVEVKASRGTSFGHPAEWIDTRKIELLTEAARAYLAENGITGVDIRFDVVTFTEGKLEHYPNAFDAQA